MATCRDIITDAFAELGDIAPGDELSARDASLGLRRLNALLLDLKGAGIGERLSDFDTTVQTLTAPYTPLNVRLLVASGSGTGFDFPYEPQNGSRFAVVDVDNTFASAPVTLRRNGRKVQGSASDLVCNTAGFNREWIYRDDLADWQRVTSLEIGDTFPLADDCRDAFAIVLAVRISPTSGLAVTQGTAAALPRAMGVLKARHRQRIVAWAENAILRTGRQSFGEGWPSVTS